MASFTWQARVYWEDTDAGGIVYYANYLRFLERARTEWLRSLGIVQSQLAADQGVVFTVVGLEAQYHRSARLDDLLLISCEPRRLGGASIAFYQQIWREDAERTLLLTASVRAACLDGRNMKPRRLPQVLVQGLP